MEMSQDALGPIMAATDGLLYPSESDAPFDPVRWPGGGKLKEAIAKVANGRPVRETTVEKFFAELEGSEEGERWKGLREAVERGLEGVRVFRVGERYVDVYVVGWARDSGGWLARLMGRESGTWAGVHTTSVET